MSIGVYQQPSLTATEQFFYDNAGWSEPPGREQCARNLAAAEREMQDAGWCYGTFPDDAAECEDGYDGSYSGVVLIDPVDGEPKFEHALWGIDTPSAEGDYGRVVAAELWSGVELPKPGEYAPFEVSLALAYLLADEGSGTETMLRELLDFHLGEERAERLVSELPGVDDCTPQACADAFLRLCGKVGGV